jgi:MFS family permease
VTSDRAQSVFKIEIREGVRRHNLPIAFFMALMVMVVTSLPAVLLPVFLQEVIGISRAHAGKINSSLAVVVEITMLLFVGMVGVLSDKTGRRILLVLGLMFSGFFYVLLGASGSLGEALGINKLALVYVARFLLGLSLLFAWPQILALVTDYTYVQGRGKAMAATGFMFTAGAFIAFSFIARLPKTIGLFNVFILACMICLAAAAIARIGITDVVARSARRRIEWKKLLGHVKKSPGLKLVYASAFASRADVIVLGIFLMIWVVKVARDFGRTPMQAIADGGIVVAISSGLGMLSYPLWGMVAEKWGRLPTLATGLAFSGLGYVLMGFVENPFSVQLKLCVVVFAIGIHAAGVGATALMGDLAPRDMIGSVLGGYHTCAAIGIIVFVQAGGFLFDHVGHAFPFVFTGVADLAVFVCALALWRGLSREEASTKKTA